ncbi:MAG: DinB family protein [Ktedonobacterales bacterium]|nr:DinB family protein [Ktedonobacterales bacterium]
MDNRWSAALWRQFGAAIDMLENALLACPSASWEQRLWYATPAMSAEFWYLTFHTLHWLDFFLTGSVEGFTPPSPFNEREPGTYPKRPYTKAELQQYLWYLRKKCQTTIVELSEETAGRPFEFPWDKGNPISYWELLLYTMRHTQEHAAQLSLFLGQNATDHEAMDAALDWVSQAKQDHPSE